MTPKLIPIVQHVRGQVGPPQRCGRKNIALCDIVSRAVDVLEKKKKAPVVETFTGSQAKHLDTVRRNV